MSVSQLDLEDLPPPRRRSRSPKPVEKLKAPPIPGFGGDEEFRGLTDNLLSNNMPCMTSEMNDSRMPPKVTRFSLF